ALWVLGYPEQAAAAARQGLARARTLGLAFTTAQVLEAQAFFGALGADPEGAADYVTELIAHSIKHSLAELEQRARFTQGALLIKKGYPRQAIEIMHNVIAADDRINNRARRTLYLGQLAAAHASLDEPEVGIEFVNDAIQTAQITSEKFFEAELYRLRGELLLKLGKKGEVEAELQRALTFARQQQAKLFELRAAMSMARLWRDQGKQDDARDLLASVYGSFTEGFNTLDLKHAKALLDELAP